MPFLPPLFQWLKFCLNKQPTSKLINPNDHYAVVSSKNDRGHSLVFCDSFCHLYCFYWMRSNLPVGHNSMSTHLTLHKTRGEECQYFLFLFLKLLRAESCKKVFGAFMNSLNSLADPLREHTFMDEIICHFEIRSKAVRLHFMQSSWVSVTGYIRLMKRTRMHFFTE